MSISYEKNGVEKFVFQFPPTRLKKDYFQHTPEKGIIFHPPPQKSNFAPPDQFNYFQVITCKRHFPAKGVKKASLTQFLRAIPFHPRVWGRRKKFPGAFGFEIWTRTAGAGVVFAAVADRLRNEKGSPEISLR